MTTTQAQIEAAAKAMEQKMFAPHELPLDDELHAKYIDTATAALTAAAETGDDPELDDITIRFQLERIKTLEAELAATIERCAHAVDNVDGDGSGMIYRKDAIAAIRALKDKP